jgi:hypothetical protein
MELRFSQCRSLTGIAHVAVLALLISLLVITTNTFYSSYEASSSSLSRKGGNNKQNTRPKEYFGAFV